jgi:biopolymer transport protein ExbB
MATIYMYYGNANAPDGQMATAVWDTDFVGVWHLVDAHDSTGRNASVNHSTTPGVGKIGGSTEFGAGTYVDTMSTAYLTRWSIEAWIRPAGGATQITNGTSIVAKFPNYLMLWSCNNSIFCKSVLMDGMNGAGTYHTSYSANAATWTHVAGTFDGVNLITYSSGNTVASTGAADISVDTTATAKIGIRQDSQGFFTGGIDEVRISKVARELPYFINTEKGARDALITYGSEELNQ